MPDSRDLPVYKLLHKIFCALVDQPQLVMINALTADDGGYLAG